MASDFESDDSRRCTGRVNKHRRITVNIGFGCTTWQPATGGPEPRSHWAAAPSKTNRSFCRCSSVRGPFHVVWRVYPHSAG